MDNNQILILVVILIAALAAFVMVVPNGKKQEEENFENRAASQQNRESVSRTASYNPLNCLAAGKKCSGDIVKGCCGDLKCMKTARDDHVEYKCLPWRVSPPKKNDDEALKVTLDNLLEEVLSENSI
jgi:hypothetical protein